MAGILFLAFTVLVRVTLRDRIPYLAALYYGAPWVLVGVGCWVLALIPRRGRRGLLIAGGLFVLLWIFAVRGPGMRGDPAAGLVLRLWTADSPQTGYPELLTRLLHGDPWMVAMTESTDFGLWLKEEAGEDLLQGYTVRARRNGLTLMLSPGLAFEGTRREYFGFRSRLDIHDVRLPDGEVIAVAVFDLDHHPLTPRGPIMRTLRMHLDEHPVPVRLLAGDFNLTPDSVFFRELEGAWRSAFAEAGAGLEVSWPWPVPLLGLDQVWGDDRIQFLGARYGRAHGSDHRKLDVWLTFSLDRVATSAKHPAQAKSAGAINPFRLQGMSMPISAKHRATYSEQM